MNFIFVDFIDVSTPVNHSQNSTALSLSAICRSLRIDKIHKNNNSFLIIPTLSSKSYFCQCYIMHMLAASGRKIVRDSCSWNLWKCVTFSPANQIVRNKKNAVELELL